MALYNLHSRGYNQYRENSVFMSTPEELTLMLYNGIIKFIMQAQLAINEKNMEKANNSIIKAQDIVHELQSALDMQYDISKNLELLYDYLYRNLMEANIRKDVDILEEMLKFTKELRNTWAEAMKLIKGQNKIKRAKTGSE